MGLTASKSYEKRKLYLIDLFGEIYIKFLGYIINIEILAKLKNLILKFYQEMNEREKELIDNLTKDKEFKNYTDLYEKILFLYSISYGCAWTLSKFFNSVFNEIINYNPVFEDFKDFFGLWTYDGCKDIIVEKCMKNLVLDFPNIKKTVLQAFSDMIRGIITILEQEKIENEESQELIEKIDAYKIEDKIGIKDIDTLLLQKVELLDNSVINSELKDFLRDCFS